MSSFRLCLFVVFSFCIATVFVLVVFLLATSIILLLVGAILNFHLSLYGGTGMFIARSFGVHVFSVKVCFGC